jgi:hypothetical protein
VRSAFTRFSPDLVPPPLRLHDRALASDVSGRRYVVDSPAGASMPDIFQPS